jgi:hypothetical protein
MLCRKPSAHPANEALMSANGINPKHVNNLEMPLQRFQRQLITLKSAAANGCRPTTLVAQ